MAEKCKQCGGRMLYIPNSFVVKCDHCSYEELFDFEANNSTTKHSLQELTQSTNVQYKIIKCDSCGAEILASIFLASQCPYCGNTFFDKNYFNKLEQPIDGIIPFKISKNQLYNKIKKWKKSLFLTPNSFKKQIQQITFFKGTYIPYWIIHSKTDISYKAQCGINTLMSKKTKWHNEEGKITTTLNNLALLGTTSVPEYFEDKTLPKFDDIIAEPFNNRWIFSDIVPLNEYFTYGFSCELPTLTIQQTLNKQEKKIRYELEQKVIKKLEKSGCDVAYINKLSYQHKELFYQLVLLPVWIASYRYKNRVYQILINGQTGEVVGNRPISKVKVFFLWLLVFCFIIYIGFIISLENYFLWAIHAAIIGIALYLKDKKDKSEHGNKL